MILILIFYEFFTIFFKIIHINFISFQLIFFFKLKIIFNIIFKFNFSLFTFFCLFPFLFSSIPSLKQVSVFGRNAVKFVITFPPNLASINPLVFLFFPLHNFLANSKFEVSNLVSWNIYVNAFCFYVNYKPISTHVA